MNLTIKWDIPLCKDKQCDLSSPEGEDRKECCVNQIKQEDIDDILYDNFKDYKMDRIIDAYYGTDKAHKNPTYIDDFYSGDTKEEIKRNILHKMQNLKNPVSCKSLMNTDFLTEIKYDNKINKCIYKSLFGEKKEADYLLMMKPAPIDNIIT